MSQLPDTRGGGFIRASTVMWETPEGRRIWKLRPLQMLVTLTMVLLAAGVALLLVLTGRSQVRWPRRWA